MHLIHSDVGNEDVVDAPEPTIADSSEQIPGGVSYPFTTVEESHTKGDPNVTGKEHDLVWRNKNYMILSRVCNCLLLGDDDVELLLSNLHDIDFTKELPKNVYDLRKEERETMCAAEFRVEVCPVPPPRTNDGHLMVRSPKLELIYLDILHICGKLLNEQVHRNYRHWHYEPTFTNDGVEAHKEGSNKFVTEMWTGSWWKDTQGMIGPKAHIIVPIMSADETPMTMTGRNVFPVYCTAGNIPRWFKTKRSGWSMVGFMPMVRPIKAYCKSPQVTDYRRAVKRWCMNRLFQCVKDNSDGYVFRLLHSDNSTEKIVVYPRVPFFVGDEPEVKHAIVGIYSGSRSRMPCSNCECVPEEQGIRHRGKPRDAEVIRCMFNQISESSSMSDSFSKLYSIHKDYNGMYFIPGLQPFCNPSCIFHQFEHGNFVFMKDVTEKYISLFGPPGSIGLFDTRWAELGRYPGCKVFTSGVSKLANVTAHEQRDMAMGFPFIVRGMRFNTSERAEISTDIHDNILEDITITYLCLRWLVSADGFTDRKLDALEAITIRFQDLLDILWAICFASTIKFKVKFHKLCHWREFIEMFGMAMSYDMGVFDSAHKYTCKAWKGKLSYRVDGAAEKKLMTQFAVAEYHTDSNPCSLKPVQIQTRPGANNTPNHQPPPLTKGKRKGPGGFRGRHDFHLSESMSETLEQYEKSVRFVNAVLEDTILAYTEAVGPCMGAEIAILLQLFQENRTLYCEVHFPNSKDVHFTLHPSQHGHVTFFSPTSYNNVEIWNASWHDDSACYIRRGMHVSYYAPNPRNPSVTRNTNIGRVMWLLSMREHQFIVLRKFRVIPTKNGPREGESCEERVLRHKDHCWQYSDPLGAHCWIFQLLREDDPSSYFIIKCGDSNSGRIESVVQMQPDFSTAQPGHSTTATHFFLLEYMLQ
jgi:hypothetical protein